MTVENAICGLAVTYDVPIDGHDFRFRREQFERFERERHGAYLKFGHESLITPRGVVENVGAVRRFISVTYPAPGLLAFGFFDAAPESQSLLRAVRAELSNPYGGCWSFSPGVWSYEDEPNARGIGEVSLTLSPSMTDARVLGVGEAAVRVWEMLTSEQAPAPVG